MLQQEHGMEVPWGSIVPPPPPPGPPPKGYDMRIMEPPPPPPLPRSPRKQHLRAAPSLEETVASTFTGNSSGDGSAMSRHIAEERRRAARAMYSSNNDPVEMARMDEEDEYSQEDEDDQVWDPVMMDRLSPTAEAGNDFSEQRWQNPEVKTPVTSNVMSYSLNRTLDGILAQRSPTSAIPPPPPPPGPPPSVQRSPLSVKQDMSEMQTSRDNLRQESLLSSFSETETAASAAFPEPSQSDSSEGSSIENISDRSAENHTEADEREKSVRFPSSVVSSLTEEPTKVSKSDISPSQSPQKRSPTSRSKTLLNRDLSKGETTPDKKKNRRFLKFMGMRKETSARESKDEPTATKTRQVNGKIVKESPAKTRTAKVKKIKKTKKKKGGANDKIGAPRDLRPGMSYKSTPNSAEIVVRKIREDPDAEVVGYQDDVSASSDTEPNRSVNLTVSTSSEDVAQVGEIESFSPPRFEDIENVTESYSSSPVASHGISLSSDQDRRFKFNGTFSNEEMSAITDPTFSTPATENHDVENGGDDAETEAGETESKSNGDIPKSNSNPNSDPLGHYWGTAQNTQTYLRPDGEPVDPFSKPFFADQASDVTSPVENLSHMAEEALKRASTCGVEVDGPEDEVEANRSQDAEENEPVVAACMGVASRHELLKKRTESLEQLKFESEPVVEEAPAALRNEIAGRRTEIMERRKMIEEKTKIQHETTDRAKESPQASRLTGKAVAYLRQQNESHGQQEHSVSRSSRASTAESKRGLINGKDTVSRAQKTDKYTNFDKPVYSASGLPTLAREQPVDAPQTPAHPSASTSLLVKLQGRKVQTIVSPPGGSDARNGELSENRGSLSSSRVLEPRTVRQQALLGRSFGGESNKTTPQRVDHETVARGMAVKRQNRELAIILGKDVVVQPRPKMRRPPLSRSVPPSMEMDESKIKDPIKRAGLRLLAKAAVPIQCEIRRYLAQQAAVDRLWAIIELQSYFRRWKCEAFLLAHTCAAAKIQAAFRGWQDRDILETEHYCATQIQKIARTYIVSIRAYDSLYRVIMAQAAARRFIARNKYHMVRESAIRIQKCFRGFEDRLEVATMHVAATIIQSTGRSYLARLQYQFDLVDVIIAQSVARRWLANQEAQRIRNVIVVQSVVRRWLVYGMLRKEENLIEHEAASKIQATWRSFQATTDFIFALADIIIIQRSVRQWLAFKELQHLKKEAAATKIQSLWRGYKARVGLLHSLVDIIIVQSVIRRHLSRYRVEERRKEVAALPIKYAAAAKIQASWRGFWQFSHYLISQFEVVRLQAAVRGHLVRSNAQLRLGCIIILQATIRRSLAQKRLMEMKTGSVLVASEAISLRETNASKKIQAAWRPVFQQKKQQKREKAAALTIERFFITIKDAVELEILLHEQRKYSRGSRKVDADDHLLESAWNESLEKGAPRRRSRRDLVVNTERSARPAEAVDVVHHDDDVSEMTSPSVFYRRSGPSPRRSYSKREMEEETCLEEAWDDTEVHEARKHRQMDDEYLQRYGLEKGSRRRHHRSPGRQSPHRRSSPGTPRERSHHYADNEFASPPRDRRKTPSSRDRRLPPSSGDDRFWSEEEQRYRKQRRSPHARTYRSQEHYEETETMRSEFSPHSSRARYSKSSGRRRSSSVCSRESPRVHDEYQYDHYEGQERRERTSNRRHSDYAYDESPRRRSSREGHRHKRMV